MKLDSVKLRQVCTFRSSVWHLQQEMLKLNPQACEVIPRVKVSDNKLDLSSNLCTFEKWKNILINRQRPIQRHTHTHIHVHTVSKFKNLIWKLKSSSTLILKENCFVNAFNLNFRHASCEQTFWISPNYTSKGCDKQTS